MAVVEEFGTDFAKIVECESGFNVRATHKNYNNSIDGGFAQINSSHLKRAKELGYDLSTIQGQFDYVRLLIKNRKYDDWTCKYVLEE